MVRHGRHGLHRGSSLLLLLHGRRWSVRDHVTVTVLLQLLRCQVGVLRRQRPACRNARLDATSLRGQSQFLETLSSQAIALVFALLGRKRRFQKLLFNLGALLIGFGQDAINLFLLFQGALAGTIVFALPTLFVLLPQMHFVVGAFLFGLVFNVLNLLAQFVSAGAALGIFAGSAIEDFLRGRDARFNVGFETGRDTRSGVVFTFIVVVIVIAVVAVVVAIAVSATFVARIRVASTRRLLLVVRIGSRRWIGAWW